MAQLIATSKPIDWLANFTGYTPHLPAWVMGNYAGVLL